MKKMMNKKNIVSLISKSLNLSNPQLKVLKREENQITFYDEINRTYLNMKETNCLSNFSVNGFFGFAMDLTYEEEEGWSRHIEMSETGKVLLDEISFTEGDYTVTFTSSEKMDAFEIGEEKNLMELVSMDTSEVTCTGNYYLVVNPHQSFFDISLKQDDKIIYKEHYAKNSEKCFECDTIRIRIRKKDGCIRSGNHVDTTIATEGDCKFYRMTYMRGCETEANYTSYFVSSVYDNLEGFAEWAPYQFSDIETPYSILLKDTDIQKEEILSYLSVMKWNLDDIRLTIFKLKNRFIINIRNVSGFNSMELPTLHSNAIDKEEIERIKEYLETIIQDQLFLKIVNQELDKFSSYLESELEKNMDVVDTFSTESLFHQEMEEIQTLMSQKNTSVIEQLLRKKNSFELDNIKGKIKEYQ